MVPCLYRRLVTTSTHACDASANSIRPWSAQHRTTLERPASPRPSAHRRASLEHAVLASQRQAEQWPERLRPEHPRDAHSATQPQRRTLRPDRGNRLLDAVRREEHAITPGASAAVVSAIVPERIARTLQHTGGEWFRILRKYHTIGRPSRSQLACKLGEA